MFVAGSIGPLPSQPQYEAPLDEMIVEQAEGLMEGGADFILFETQPNRAALERCAAAMRRLPDVPFVLSFAIVGAGETASGESVERMLAPLPADSPQPIAWGMNCGIGPDGLLGAVEQAVRLTTLPLIVQPNAGMPKEVENRRIYLCSPEYLAEYAKRYVALGASAVGGCCGTTPEHIREVALAVKPLVAGEGRAAGGAGGRRRAEDARPVGREIAARRPAGRPPVDHHRRTAAAARLRPALDDREGQDAARSAASTRSTSPTARGPAPGSRR